MRPDPVSHIRPGAAVGKGILRFDLVGPEMPAQARCRGSSRVPHYRFESVFHVEHLSWRSMWKKGGAGPEDPPLNSSRRTGDVS